MRSRTTNPSNKDYPRYGGRGITLSEDWLDYNNFCEWALRSGYEEGLTIDRIDNDKNYEADNCMWITNAENVKKRWEDNPILPPVSQETRERISKAMRKVNQDNPRLREKFIHYRDTNGNTKISTCDIEALKQYKQNNPNWKKDWKILHTQYAPKTNEKYFRFNILARL